MPKKKQSYKPTSPEDTFQFDNWKIFAVVDNPDSVIEYIVDIIAKADEMSQEATQFSMFSFTGAKGHYIAVGVEEDVEFV